MYNGEGGRGGGGREKKKFFADNVYRPGARNTSGAREKNETKRSEPLIRHGALPRPNAQPIHIDNQRPIGPNAMLYLKDTPAQVSELTFFTAAPPEPPPQSLSDDFRGEPRETPQKDAEIQLNAQEKRSSFCDAPEAEATDADVALSQTLYGDKLDSRPPSQEQSRSRWTRTVFRPCQEPSPNRHTYRAAKFRLETPPPPRLPPPPETDRSPASPSGATPRRTIFADTSSPMEPKCAASAKAIDRSLEYEDEPVPTTWPRNKAARRGSFDGNANSPPPQPPARKHSSGRGQSPPSQRPVNPQYSPTRNPDDGCSIPKENKVTGGDATQGHASTGTGEGQNLSSSGPLGARLFGTGRGRQVTTVDNLALSLHRIREPGDDTSEDTFSHKHCRVASDPDALILEPGEFENENYRSEPTLNYSHAKERDSIPFEPMPRTLEADANRNRSDGTHFFGGEPTGRSLISDESREHVDQREREEINWREQKARQPSLLSAVMPSGKIVLHRGEEPLTEMPDLRALRPRLSNSTAGSNLSFSTVGSGDAMRIVSLPADVTSGRRLSTPSAMERSSVHSTVARRNEMPREDWPCNQCSYVNGGCDDSCAVCGTDVQDAIGTSPLSSSQSRGSFQQWRSSRSVLRTPVVLGRSLTEQGPWLCLLCTYMNQNELHLSCEICGEPRASSDTNVLKMMEDPEADAHCSLEADLTDEIREKIKQKERILDLLGEQGKILTELKEMDAFKHSDDARAVQQFQKEVAERGQYLDKIREELTQALEMEQEEQKLAEEEQQRRRSTLLEVTGADSFSDLAGNNMSPEALEWMAQQRMLDEWRSLVQARSLQLEEMRLQQEESLTRYGSRTFSV